MSERWKPDVDRSTASPAERSAGRGEPVRLRLEGLRLEITLPPETLAELAAHLAPYLPAQGPPEASPYLSVIEAAAYLRSSRQRVYDLLSSRRLPRHKDGSRVLIRRADLDEYLNQQ